MVLKDAIFNLYQRKIPSDSRIARNAMYRHMWSFFKEDKISAFQSNYREYIKGIKLLTGQEPLNYEGCEKDLEVLQSIGVQNLFDFQACGTTAIYVLCSADASHVFYLHA